jgi:hypothetical protein
MGEACSRHVGVGKGIAFVFKSSRIEKNTGI